MAPKPMPKKSSLMITSLSKSVSSENNEETGVQSIRDVKEQEVYFGEIPLMTDSGTFIINGT